MFLPPDMHIKGDLIRADDVAKFAEKVQDVGCGTEVRLANAICEEFAADDHRIAGQVVKVGRWIGR
jgi:hypothetical protein